MKIGILTLSASDNCGSLLQAYAMQTVLKARFRADVEVLDFRCEGAREMYDLFSRKPWKYPRKTLNNLLHFPTVSRQKKDYEYFRRNWLNATSRQFATAQELAEVAEEYDVILCGSDQVWNVNIPDFDPAYFLGWTGNTSRVAYAPSLGGCDFTAFPDQAALKQWLLDFSALSTREQIGVESVKDVTGLEIPIVPDPTLLIGPEQWQAVPGERLVQEPYIFYYSWAYEDEELNRIVQQYARKRGLSVYVIDAFKWPKLKPKDFGFRMAPAGGPQTFLNLMKYADAAFVQSFHGVIFAYMMQRDFYLLDNRPVGQMDNRLASILKLLNTEDRVARCLEDIREEKIDYSAVPESLAESREIGFDYLDQALAATVEI
ncbi:MAG: polysaccharide pyruvyl transferase family protein [Oscillospiraceae bacterium]|nr:polysaccharide pyruvyl transferase family protein [Oscillospiraceae bacterium]